jgi:cytosine/adenosine deaminase-related metal-dependent hydrolase
MALALLGSTYTDLEVTLADLRLSEELGLMSSVHQGGYPGAVEGGYPEIIKHIDISRHNIVHGTQIPDDDLKRIIDAGASITATPAAEIRTGFREPMIRRVAEAGGIVSIGSDSAINAPSDMFTAMRDSLMVQRLFNHQRAEVAKPSPRLRHGTHIVSRNAKLPARVAPTSNDALTWATRGNAWVLGMQDEVGSLTVGRKADLVLMNPATIGMAPALNPVDAIVGCGSPASVDTVIVGGAILKSGGRLAYPHLDRLLEDIRRLGHDLYASLGFDALRDPLLPTVF